MESLSLLGPPTCPASWPASLVKQITMGPAKKVELVVPTNPVKPNTSQGSGRGKLPSGSSGKKSVPPKQVTDYWGDPLRKKEDAEAHKQEEDRHQKKLSGPVLSLDEHEDPISVLTSRAAPSQSSEPSGLLADPPPEGRKEWCKIR